MAEVAQEIASTNSGIALDQVTVPITVSVGSARMTVSELLALQSDAVLRLDRRVEDPVEVFVGDRLVARGLLESPEGQDEGFLSVRLVEILEQGPSR